METGTIPEAENLLGNTQFRTLTLFNKVFGNHYTIYVLVGKIMFELFLKKIKSINFKLMKNHFTIGVGPSTANLWYDKGYRSLQEVLDHAKLAKAVKLGIQLLPDFELP